MLGRTSNRQPPKEDLTQSEFKEIQQDWTSSKSESEYGHDVADDYPLLRPQPIRYSRNPSIEQRPAMTLNLADHSSGGQATPTHESITMLPTKQVLRSTILSSTIVLVFFDNARIGRF
jgi:hypothetical protein